MRVGNEDHEAALALISQLDRYKGAGKSWDLLARLWPCTRCHAGVGAPCLRPDGIPYVHHRRYSPTPTYHVTRADRAELAARETSPQRWRADLRDGVAPSRVIAEMQCTKLYKRLVELGRIKETTREADRVQA